MFNNSSSTAGDFRLRRFTDAAPIDPPVAFEYLGHKGSIQVMCRGKLRKVSHMRVGFQGIKPFAPKGFARLVSRPPLDIIVNPGGWAPQKLDDERLDATFMMFATGAASDFAICRPERVAALLALARELGGFPVGITIGPALLQVEKVCHTARPADQLRLIYHVIDLLDALVGKPSRTTGEIAPGLPPALDLSGAICQVCAMPLDARVVFCEGCVTPHHHECWNYIGGCSTYACLRRSFVADSVAA